MHLSLGTFIENCESVISNMEKAADRVTAIAPLMQTLAAGADKFLSPEHFRSEPDNFGATAAAAPTISCNT